jgi:hypothetical protein
MFDIYEKEFTDSFAGRGKEWLVVKAGTIKAHGLAWDDPSVDCDFDDRLTGQPVSKRGKGWRKLTGFALENAQGWAVDMVEFA